MMTPHVISIVSITHCSTPHNKSKTHQFGIEARETITKRNQNKNRVTPKGAGGEQLVIVLCCVTKNHADDLLCVRL